MPSNIQINLNAAYPLEPTSACTENQWAFEVSLCTPYNRKSPTPLLTNYKTGSHWPDQLQPFTFRWLHEHQAYQIHHSSDHVRNFVVALKKQIGLSPVLTPDQETKIYNKTHKYLANWIKTWQQCGLLVLKGDMIVRHRELDKALTIRRAEYIAVVQNGRLEGPGMLTPKNSRNQALLKRVSHFNYAQPLEHADCD